MEQKSLNNKPDSILSKIPQKILQESREEIDKIDNEIIDLIHRRTSLSKTIVLAKLDLNLDIFDPIREKSIYEKIEKIAIEKNLNVNTKNSLLEIMNILIDLSKKEQKKIINDDNKNNK